MIKMYVLNTAQEYDEMCSVEVLEQRLNFSVEIVEERYKNVSEIFQLDMPITAYVTDCIEVWNNLSQTYNFPDFACAVSLEESVFIKSKNLWSEFNIGSLEETIIHEVVHCFMRAYSDVSIPIWLNEAISIYLSGQHKYYVPINTDDVDMNALDYNHPMLYDLSISRLLELLEGESLKSIITKIGQEVFE